MNENGHFKFCYMALGASIEGWKYCRPTISVDGTFLKCKFVGTLLTASSVDGNNQIFPLAFAIVDSENDASWKWFFQNIHNSFGDRENLVIVSDKHLSIPKGVLSVFKDVEYCVCMQHLLRNLKLSFKDPLIDKFYFSCAKSYTINDFEYNMRSMESICPNIRSYLCKVGFERWSRAFSRRRRYGMMTTNTAESVNSVLKDVRDLPVASLLDSIRDILQKWFHDRSNVASSIKTVLTSWAENTLRQEHEKSRSLLVGPISNVEYKVMDGDKQFIVKIDSGCCSCRVWDFEEIPCSHALAVFQMLNLDSYSYVSPYYYSRILLATYKDCVRPVGVHLDWKAEGDVIKALPHIVKRQAGRPKSKGFHL